MKWPWQHDGSLQQGGVAESGEEPTEIDVEAIRAALHEVLDPEVGMSIVDLGLVYAIEASGQRVDITLTMTSPACPVGESMREQVRERALAASPEGTEVEVDLVTDPPWEPSRMSEAARIRFGWNRR